MQVIGAWAISRPIGPDRKSTRLNSSHRCISYAVFCLKKKKRHSITTRGDASRRVWWRVYNGVVSAVVRGRKKNRFFFFFNDTATTEIYTLSLHDALPIWSRPIGLPRRALVHPRSPRTARRARAG